MKNPSIVHSDSLPGEEGGNGKFQFSKKSLSREAGSQKLGCRLYTVEPGKSAWPYHFHYGNEEFIFILEGSGTLRLNEERFAVESGDYIALPVGPEHAHELINTSSGLLRYLCVSTMVEPDVCIYPDSKKVGIFAVDAPGRPVTEKTLEEFLPHKTVGYYEGEN